MLTFKVLLEYHGGGFSGWAAQPGLRTVEGVLSDALETVLGIGAGALGRRAHRYGRARAGAGGQLPCADAEPRVGCARSLNGVLPQDVAVVTAEQAPDGFDARRDARSRTYCYRVLTRAAPSPFERDRALWWPQPLDEAALARCARRCPARTTSRRSRPTQTDHVRFERDVVEGRVAPRRSSCSSSGSRPTPSCATWCGCSSARCSRSRAGRRDVPSFAHLLAGAERASAGPTAEPHGLCLESVLLATSSRSPAATPAASRCTPGSARAR